MDFIAPAPPKMKASSTSSFDGVWDRELDRNLPASKL